MEISSRAVYQDAQSSHGSSSSSSTPSTPTHLHSPLPITRSDPNSPYPTTFVTADTGSFKQVVQMLTGSSETPPSNSKTSNDHLPPPPSSRSFVIPPVKTAANKKQQLYERRNSLKNSLLMINPLPRYQNASFSPRKPSDILSPSILDFPALTLSSPVTPLTVAGDEDQFDKSSHSSEEERAIAEKGFYLHPSPMSTPRDYEPQLLPLFPVTSPRVSE